MTLTQIAKRCRDSWRAWAQVDDENEDGDGLPDGMDRQWVDQHIQLCDAVIESEIMREEFEWLKEFERAARTVLQNRYATTEQQAVAIADANVFLHEKRADREGPQI